MKYYVVSDGSEDTAAKIAEFFLSAGIDDSEVSQYAFMANKKAVYYFALNGKIRQTATPPQGYEKYEL